jgi:hypothetical protein
MAEGAGVRPGAHEQPLDPDAEAVGGPGQVDQGGW